MSAIDVLIAGGAGAAGVVVPASLLLRRAWSRLASVSRELPLLRWQATHDGLTGLLNRTGFADRAAALVASPPVALTVALVDLNGFKQVNDRYGHGVGDVTLIAMARHIEAACGSAGFAGRLGGDEFVIVLPAMEAGVCLSAIAAGVTVEVTDGVSVFVTGSVGAVDVSMPTDLAVALAHADAAMYRAKQLGGGPAWHDVVRDDDTVAVRPVVRTRDLPAEPVLRAVA